MICSSVYRFRFIEFSHLGMMGKLTLWVDRFMGGGGSKTLCTGPAMIITN